MPDVNDQSLSELLLLWEDSRRQGAPATPEVLCAAHPELLSELRRRIHALESVYRVPNRVESDQGPGSTGPEAEAPPSRRVGDYRILEILGRGGMGVVYRARQLNLNRVVALKMLVNGPHASPADLARFRNEAEAVARLQHPNIVQIFEVGEQDGRSFFTMEWIDGGSLEQQLEGRPWPAGRAAQLLETLARAMHTAHLRGIVHRDLKPANILIGSDGTPKITDFGLAKLREPDDSTATNRPPVTQTGAVLGTPSYMAPEQAAGRTRDVGPPTDVHALGVILYELLTGRGPFPGSTPLETLEQVRHADPVPPRLLRPTLPRDVETICLKCLEKDPARRYESAQALADDLRRFLEGSPIAARASTMLDQLALALGRSQHDREFRPWGNTIMALAPVLTLPHLVLFGLAVAAPAYLAHAMIIPWVVLLGSIALVFRLQTGQLHIPSSPAVRQFGSMLVAHWLAATLVFWLCRTLIAGDDVPSLFLPYPLVSVLAGQLFFNLGSSYWGKCYLAGIAFFALALIMPLNLLFAPLEFAAVALLTFTAIGLHLRRLGQELDPPLSAGS